MANSQSNQNRSFAGVYRDEVNKYTGHIRVLLKELVTTVNHTDNPNFMFNNQPFPLKRGQLVTSLNQLQINTGLSVQNIRTTLKNLENLEILTNTSTNILTNKARLITFIDIDKFLLNGSELTNPLTNPLTNGSQTPNKRVTTNNKNNKKENEPKNDIQIDSDLTEIIKVFNQVFSKKVSSTVGFEANYRYWMKVHPTDKILLAIQNARKDKFWRDKLTLQILFRRKNPRGEDVDYIEDFANRSSQQGNIAII